MSFVNCEIIQCCYNNNNMCEKPFVNLDSSGRCDFFFYRTGLPFGGNVRQIALEPLSEEYKDILHIYDDYCNDVKNDKEIDENG